MPKKYRNRAQENTRIVRIGLGDYALLRQLSTSESISIREVVHHLITGVIEKGRSSPQMPLDMRVIPVLRVTPQSATVVNDTKHSIFPVKPKRGVVRE